MTTMATRMPPTKSQEAEPGRHRRKIRIRRGIRRPVESAAPVAAATAAALVVNQETVGEERIGAHRSADCRRGPSCGPPRCSRSAAAQSPVPSKAKMRSPTFSASKVLNVPLPT